MYEVVGVAWSKEVWFHCGNFSLHVCPPSVLLSMFTLSTSFSLCQCLLHIRFFLLLPSFYASLFSAYASWGLQESWALHRLSTIATIPGPYYHANPHSGTRIVIYVMCCVRKLCTSASTGFHSLRLHIIHTLLSLSLFSHTSVSAKCKKTLQTPLWPPSSCGVARLRPRCTEESCVV